ncbi:RNA-directed DNA polymerase [Halobacteriovorax sp. HFRX-2_2]|uniref:RNA-directed DNA polymerase n=1 Tax=unclassified Halobacteriovorax TaxID=2639665 RepID=UPI0037129E1C
MEDSFKLALKNIARYGDTDIFPYPVEKKIFYDFESDCVNILKDMQDKFSVELNDCPPLNKSLLCPVGYTGFRWATQIDPFWNAYFLSLVLKISDEIENERIPKTENYVFSYRYFPDTESHKLFDEKYNWKAFQEESLKLCEEYKFVLICDISDFYSRIYHHRLENALQKLNLKCDTVSRIMKLLSKFSNSKSYGLPVGGNASRILSELVLNSTDKLLKTEGVRFCRFADDYHIFTNNKEEAYKCLRLLSELLLENEGLSLQKTKTRVMQCEEFLLNSEIYGKLNASNDHKNQFLRLNLRYDPYSETADEDYNELKEQIGKFDILGILKKELHSKTRVHRHLVSRLLKAIRHLDVTSKKDAVFTLLENLKLLAPVFSQVMMTIYDICPELHEDDRRAVFDILISEIKNENYLFQIDLNLHYVTLILGQDRRDENEQILNNIFKKTNSELIKRDVILIMTKWRYTAWISNLRTRFGSMSKWEKNSFLIASYILGDEGKHWRNHNKKSFDSFSVVYLNWANSKLGNGDFRGII